MKIWNLFFVLLPFCCDVNCVPTSTASPLEDGAKDSSEVSIPENMNIADYYYSIFGKHLDYDYREPIITFDEPVQNELSDESDTTQTSPDILNRQKRFIFVPASYYNATRRWNQQVRRLRMERRRLRMERRRQWQQNRINYLSRRSENLKRQAARLQQVTQRQQAAAVSTRSASAQASNIQKTTVTTTTTTAKPTTTTSISFSVDQLATAASNTIPVKQVPLPSKP